MFKSSLLYEDARGQAGAGLEIHPRILKMRIMKVISRNNFPAIIPIATTVAYATALDYWNAHWLVWGIVGVYMSFTWIAWAYRSQKAEEQDIFKEDTPEAPRKKSKFQEKLDKAMEQSRKAKQ